MKKTSKKLNKWADVLVTAGVVMVILSIVAWIISEESVTSALLTGISFILSSALFQGISVLVQNAEEQIAERQMFRPKTGTEK